MNDSAAPEQPIPPPETARPGLRCREAALIGSPLLACTEALPTAGNLFMPKVVGGRTNAGAILIAEKPAALIGAQRP